MRLRPGPDFRYKGGPKDNAAFTLARDLGGKGAMSVRCEHRVTEWTAVMAAPVAARILGLLIVP